MPFTFCTCRLCCGLSLHGRLGSGTGIERRRSTEAEAAAEAGTEKQTDEQTGAEAGAGRGNAAGATAAIATGTAETGTQSAGSLPGVNKKIPFTIALSCWEPVCLSACDCRFCPVCLDPLGLQEASTSAHVPIVNYKKVTEVSIDMLQGEEQEPQQK